MCSRGQLQAIFDGVVGRDPAQPEFLQAVEVRFTLQTKLLTPLHCPAFVSGRTTMWLSCLCSN